MPDENAKAIGESAAATAHSPVDPVAILTGVVSTALGLVSIALPSSTKMAFSAAVSLVWLGLGFVAMGVGWRVAAGLLVVPVALADFVLFIATLTHWAPGLDKMMLRAWWPEAPVNNYAMNPNAALGCALIAVAVLLSTSGREFRWRPTAIVLSGSGAVALGLNELAGHLAGLPTSYGMELLVSMAPVVAVALTLLGAGVLAASWRQSHDVPTERHSWILVVVAMTGIVISTSLWQALMLVGKLHVESSQRLRSHLAGAVLVLGLLATALLGGAIYLAQTERLRMLLAERLRNQAENEVAARKLVEQNLRQAEEALAQQVKKLARSNEELMQFAFVASHDLQEPLRKIVAFGGRLSAHSAGALDEQGRDYLGRMQNAAQRMGQLIESLLELSRVSTRGAEFEVVDLNRIVSGVITDLEARIQQTSGRVESGQLPTVMADRMQMQQLFQNLVGNALKFHKENVPPVVRIRSQRRDNGCWQIHVADNGIGFEEKYVDRIFRPFQRLHARNEFEGSGMGLAICSKIAARHAGELTAHSQPGIGSDFVLTLPGMPIAKEAKAS